MKLKLKVKSKRILSSILVIMLILGQSVMPVMASTLEEYREVIEGCVHHTHDENCSYVGGTSCTHLHDENCSYEEGIESSTCKHTHDDVCRYIEAISCNYDSTICNKCYNIDEESIQEKCLETESCILELGHTGNCKSEDEGTQVDQITITEVTPLEDNIANQSYELGKVTEEEILFKLPKEIEVTTSSAITVSQPIKVPVSWNSDKVFEEKVANTYTYTSELKDSKYILEEGVSLPYITIDVIESFLEDQNGERVVTNIDVSKENANISQDGDYIITGTSITNTIAVQDGVTANITLNGVNIDVSSTPDATAFEIQGSAIANITLAPDTRNNFKSGSNKAGIQVETKNSKTATLNISGTGKLEASGGAYGAGIGGSSKNSGGNIIINGGIVTAKGRDQADGIGRGYGGYNGSFSTGIDGSAVIYASSISDQRNKHKWTGMIFEDVTGKIYGESILKAETIIPEGYTLDIDLGNTFTISENVVLTNNGVINNRGTINNNNTIINDGVINNYHKINGSESILGNTPEYKPSIDFNITVTGGKEDIDYSVIDNTLFVKTSENLTIENKNPNEVIAGRIVIKDGITANITLAGVNINAYSRKNTAFEIQGDAIANIILGKGSTNIFRSYYNKAGIQVETKNNKTATLNISGEGSLEAYGGQHAAGIGCNYDGNNENCGNIRIESGLVKAIGGDRGVGIGSQVKNDGKFSTGTNGNAVIVANSISDKSNEANWSGTIFEGNIGKTYGDTILKGNLEIPASHTLYIDIGDSFTIDSESKLTNNGNIYNLGTLNNEGTIENNKKITNIYKINNGSEINNNGTIDNFNQISNSGKISGEKPNNKEPMDGDMIVNGGEMGVDYIILENNLIVLTSRNLTIQNGDPNKPIDARIYIKDGITANITLNRVYIEVPSTKNAGAFEIIGNGAANIILESDTFNILKSGKYKPGIQVQEENNKTGTLTISGEGSLEVHGGEFAAGIGGEFEKSRDRGKNGGNITINGGTIISYGGSGAAGIGGSYLGLNGTINIAGGEVTAAGIQEGAGIGTGKMDNLTSSRPKNITIQNAVVKAKANSGGAGIGGGNNAHASEINIINSIVTATASGSSGGVGIGGGKNGDVSAIHIEGSTINAQGANGVDIGTGNNGVSSCVFKSKDSFINTKSISNLTNENIVNNIIFNENNGEIYGDKVVLRVDAEVPANHTLNIGEGKTLIINPGVTLNNNGTINNSGIIENYGMITGNPVNNTGGGEVKHPSTTVLTFEKNGAPVTEAFYGDKITIKANIDKKTALELSKANNSVDFLIKRDGKEISIGSAEVINNVASIEIDLLNDKISDNAFMYGKNIIKVNFNGSGTGDNALLPSEAEAELKVKQKQLTDTMVSNIDNQKYTGSAIMPPVTVTDGNQNIITTKDYEVGHSNNTNIGIATVTITGKNNYTGTVTKNFEIIKSDSIVSVTPNSSEITYGEEVIFTVDIGIGSRNLAGKQDKVEFFLGDVNGTSLGTADITYENDVSGRATFTTRKLPAGTQTITAVYGGSDNLNTNKDTTEVIVNRKSLTDTMVSDIRNHKYTGRDIEPTVTVTDGSQSIITTNDYEIAYSANKNVGIATVTITGKNNYTGTVTKNFEITKSDSIVTVTPSSAEITYGEEVIFTVDIGVSARNLAGKQDKVEFFLGDVNEISLGVRNVIYENDGSGKATFTTRKLPAGPQTITAVYGGSNNLNTNQATTEVVVNKKLLTWTTGIVSNKEFDGTTDTTITSNPTLVGVVEGDDITSKDGIVKFANANAGVDKVVTAIDYGIEGSDIANYKIEQPTFNNAKITPKLLTDTMVSDIADKKYTGSAIEPTVTVIDGSKSIITTDDYEVGYSANKNVGIATVTITGKNNYTGTVTKNFEITKSDSIVSVTSNISEIIYGDEVIFTVDIGVSVRSLAGKQDKVEFFLGDVNGTSLGTADVIYENDGSGKATFTTRKLPAGPQTITAVYGGSNNLNTNQATIEVVVNRKTLTWTTGAVSNKEFDGNTNATITSNPTLVGVVEGDDITSKDGIVKFANANAGVDKVVTAIDYGIEGSDIANYKIEQPTFNNAKITPKSLTDTMVSDIADKKYTGSAIEPTVTVIDGSKSIITTDDYTVQYSANKNVGIATVTITGKNNYTGIVTKNFEIIKSDSIVTVIPNSSEITYGEEVIFTVDIGVSARNLAGKQDKVEFFLGDINGISLGTADVIYESDGSGKAIFTTRKLPVGTQTITTVYGGSNNLNAKQATTEVVVNKKLLTWTTGIVSNKEFDGNTNVTITSNPTLVGVVEGDDITSKDGIVKFANANTGVDKVVTAIDYGIEGADVDNYTIEQPTFDNADITPKSLTDEMVSNITDHKYTGSAIEPTVTVTDGSQSIITTDDYEVGYSANKNVGIATVTITGKNNYTGTVTKNFEITKSDSIVTVTPNSPEITYGDEVIFTVDIGVSARNLAGKQDKVEFFLGDINGISLGTADVIYESDGSGKATFTINKIPAGTQTITSVYGGSNNLNANQATTEVVVNRKSLTDTMVSNIDNQKYTGSAINPVVIVTDGDPSIITTNDYEVVYSNNTNVGTATVTITGKNNYKGTVTKTFEITGESGGYEPNPDYEDNTPIFNENISKFKDHIKWPVMKDVSLDKSFKIKFTKDLDQIDIEDHVRVYNSYGAKLSIKVKVNGNVLEVYRDRKYNSNSTYYLEIDEGIKAKDGEVFTNKIIMKFTTK